MEYKKLTKKTLPPIDNRKRFLLWRDARSTDGGFATVAQRVQYNDNAPYIRYVKPFKGWKVLRPDDYRNCLWAEIETPPQITARMERRQLRQREREKRKASAKQSA
jgi:hypothetical protein